MERVDDGVVVVVACNSLKSEFPSIIPFEIRELKSGFCRGESAAMSAGAAVIIGALWFIFDSAGGGGCVRTHLSRLLLIKLRPAWSSDYETKCT